MQVSGEPDVLHRSLSTLFSAVDAELPLWRTPDERLLTAKRIQEELSAHRATRDSAFGRFVAIHATRNLDCAFLMALLDGVARSMVFLPASLSLEAARSIIDRARPDLLLTDGTLDFTFPGLPTLSLKPFCSAVANCEHTPLTTHVATQWVIPTSGTTGVPKLVAHSLASLTRTVRRNPAIGGQHRWGALYNLTGFAGLQVFLQSWFGGSCLLMTDDSMDLRQRLSLLVRGGCTALSATPAMWRRILMAPEAHLLPLRQITLGGEIANQQILDALRREYPNARLTHIYASTEAGVGFAVTDGREGFPASLLNDPPLGLAIRVSEDGRLEVRAGGDRQQYVGSTASLRDDEGFVDTGDIVDRVGDRFLFRGRADGRITVGGNKVYPEEVERVLCSFPGVADAVVGSIRSSLMGELLEAKIVLKSGITDPAEFRRRLLEHCRANLAPYKAPAIVNFVEAIVMNSNGKVLRTATARGTEV